jgi:small GTP-binding protein
VGKDKFRFLLKFYAEGADGAFFLYDITNFNSFNNIKNWVEVIREAKKDIPIVLVGSKLDLEDLREISTKRGEETANEYNLYPFIEISSKSGENVDKTFDDLVEIVFKKLW